MPRLAIGGMEIAAFKLINALPEMRHCLCLLYSDSSQQKIFERLSNNEIEIFYLDKRSGIDVSLFRKIERICRRNKVDILHCRNFASTFYGGLSRLLYAKASLIADIRGVDLRKRRLLIYKVLVGLGLIDKLVVVSEDLKTRLLSESISLKNLTYIPNGVDLNLFLGNTRKGYLLQPLGIPKGKIVIGTVGRLEKVKNYPLLISAFKMLTKKYEKVYLVFIGEGSEAPMLKGLAQRYGIDGSVSFLGYQEDIPGMLRGLDIFVSSSLSEGMPNVIMEAMASKLPVVVSRVGAAPELVDHGHNGLIFESNSAEELVSHLEALIANPMLRARLGEKAFLKIRSKFSIEATARKYAELYNAL